MSSFDITPLLIHSDEVPHEAKSALRAAQAAPEEERAPLLEAAARELYLGTSLGCGEVRELIGLAPELCR